jgi:hypothetical protein
MAEPVRASSSVVVRPSARADVRRAAPENRALAKCRPGAWGVDMGKSRADGGKLEEHAVAKAGAERFAARVAAQRVTRQVQQPQARQTWRMGQRLGPGGPDEIVGEP